MQFNVQDLLVVMQLNKEVFLMPTLNQLFQTGLFWHLQLLFIANISNCYLTQVCADISNCNLMKGYADMNNSFLLLT